MWLLCLMLFRFGCVKNEDTGVIDLNNGLKHYESHQENVDDGIREESQEYGAIAGLSHYQDNGRHFKRTDKNSGGFGILEPYKYEDPSYEDLLKRSNYRRNDERESYGDYGRDQSYYDEAMIRKLDETFGYTGPTANDEPDNLIRPCAFDDWQCIRKYFAANSQCTPAYGPIPDPFTIKLHTVYFATVNATLSILNYKIRGFSNAKINDFYVNTKSGNLVFAIDVANVSLSSPRSYLRFRRTAKESIVLADYANSILRSVTFTAVIPKVPHLRLENADIHADIDYGTPDYEYGPGIYNSTDPDVLAANIDFRILLPYNVREGFVLQAPLFTAKYIQENICDFGVKLITA